MLGSSGLTVEDPLDPLESAVPETRDMTVPEEATKLRRFDFPVRVR